MSLNTLPSQEKEPTKWEPISPRDIEDVERLQEKFYEEVGTKFKKFGTLKNGMVLRQGHKVVGYTFYKFINTGHDTALASDPALSIEQLYLEKNVRGKHHSLVEFAEKIREIAIAYGANWIAWSPGPENIRRITNNVAEQIGWWNQYKVPVDKFDIVSLTADYKRRVASLNHA